MLKSILAVVVVHNVIITMISARALRGKEALEMKRTGIAVRTHGSGQCRGD